MIYIDFEGLLNIYESRSKGKLTVSEIAKDTGITRKALSSLKNHPNSSISSEHLGTLTEYFFHKFVPLIKPGSSHALLMNWVTTTLIQIYPEHADYKVSDAILQGFSSGSVSQSQFPPSMLWSWYVMQDSKDAYDLHSKRKADVYNDLFEDRETEKKERNSKGPIKTESKKK